MASDNVLKIESNALYSNKTGIVQWFHLNQYDEVNKAIEDFEKMGITHVRTNLSWADWHQPGGKKWFDWLFDQLSKTLTILPCVLYTPPSIGIKPKTSAPPVNPKDYADFVDVVISHYGKYFEYVELWNEPNNLAEYDFTLDPDWNIFCEMVGSAAYWCKQKGKKTVLGGMSPIDPNWLNHMFRKNLMQYIDVVGVHAFPDVFDYNWEGWDVELKKIQEVLDKNLSNADIWITEVGFSTWQRNEQKQLDEFIKAIKTKATKVFWYGLRDLSPELAAVDRYHLDEREYHFGMKHADNSRKLLYTVLTKGIDTIGEYEWLVKDAKKNNSNYYTLITGGSGFIGVNLADKILSQGKNVLVFDNLSREGVENNLKWLKDKYPDKLQVMIADIRNRSALKEAVEGAEQVFHFAAQVAVTSSLSDPLYDFDINAMGTLNLLEAIRKSKHKPSLVYTSTNKVYGELDDLGIIMNATRYIPEDVYYKENGIGEDRNLNFYSPYGCSKGVADQYVLDYGRTYGLKTVVFRMSCIYGPHQFGTEDQGWVAHFLIQALKEKPILLYGDGKQVRDILFVDDLVNAFLLAEKNMDQLSGKAFNIGGGVHNTVSLLELVELIEKISGIKLSYHFSEWRPGDQKYYVSDIKSFQSATGWSPEVSTKEGIQKLYNWLVENAKAPEQKPIKKKYPVKTMLPIN
jgi:CDP-paratose 2-epimerase